MGGWGGGYSVEEGQGGGGVMHVDCVVRIGIGVFLSGMHTHRVHIHASGTPPCHQQPRHVPTNTFKNTQVYEQCSWLMNTWQGDFPHVVAGQVRQLLAQTEQRVAALAATCQGPQGRPGEGRAVPAPQGPAPVALDGAVGDLARERSGGLQGPSVFGGARTTSSR